PTDPSPSGGVNTDGGAYVAGGVQAGGDFVGRDKVVNQIQTALLNGTYVDRRVIVNGAELSGPELLDAIVKEVVANLGLDHASLANAFAKQLQPHEQRQIGELIAAQAAVGGSGSQLAPPTALRLGMLAAANRNYD